MDNYIPEEASTWWNSSMSISASAFQELSSVWKQGGKLLFKGTSQLLRKSQLSRWLFQSPWSFICPTSAHTPWYPPEMFSWKITLVPFRKFFPIKKTSSSPFTEQLCRLFLRISGTPAGWATTRRKWDLTENTHTQSAITPRPLTAYMWKGQMLWKA